MSKRYDLVLFGATGFTGRQAFLHLARSLPEGLRWAIGGRNPEKLRALLAEVPQPGNPPDILTADATEPASVGALVRRARVLVQLAGPYSPHGEHFIEACVEHGTDYLDLTGEIFWVRKMVAKYHAAAAAARVRIVPVCGFEALPYDIGALLAARALVAAHGVRATEVEIVTSLTGPRALRTADMVSGGTVASMRAMLAAEPDGSTSDPACLVQDAALAERIRRNSPYSLQARWSERAGAWLAPMVPAPFVNPPVVHRTVSLLAGATRAKDNPFAEDFRYQEALSTRSFAPFPLAQRLLAETMARSIARMMSTAESSGRFARLSRSATNEFLERFAPAPGEGPSERALEQMGYALELTARGAGGEEVHGQAVGQGHPGYRSTPALIAECAVLLATRRSALPRHYGLLTPAAAFGEAARDAMSRAGLQFSFP
jgi:short subunit dehydrogenase-like uncharacterized protein